MKAKIQILGILAIFGTLCPMQAQIDFGSLSEQQLYKRENKYNNWSIGIGMGPVFYYTDIIDYSVMPKDHYRFAPTIMVARQFNRPWGIEAQLMMADMYGQKNGRYFSGHLVDATLNLTLSINQMAILAPLATGGTSMPSWDLVWCTSEAAYATWKTTPSKK